MMKTVTPIAVVITVISTIKHSTLITNQPFDAVRELHELTTPYVNKI